MKTLTLAESNAIGVQILDAIEWVHAQNDSDDHNGDSAWDAALHRTFLALYRREPDADDQRAGLWNLCCAACPHCGKKPKSNEEATRENGLTVKVTVGEKIGVAKI